MERKIHEDFIHFLKLKDQELIQLYTSLRNMVISLYPDCNELLYQTHALTSVYSITDRLSDAFCHIPVYSHHLNLGFNKGTLLDDPDNLLIGTGKLIRHIPIKEESDFKNKKVKALINTAIHFSKEDMDNKPMKTSQIISKIKINT